MIKTYKLWLPEEEAILKQHLGKMSYKDIAKNYLKDRTGSSLQSHAKFLELENNYIHKLYSKDENFFSIPNALNSYYAGFLSSDGNISPKYNVVKLGLGIKDKGFIEQFIKDTKFSGNYFEYITKSPLCPNPSNMVGLNICSAQWVQDLEKNFNVIPNKTFRIRPPNIDNDLLKYAFALGYADGDGTVHFNKRNEFLISYTSCSKDILEWLKSLIEKDFWIGPRKLKPNSVKLGRKFHNNCYSYTINGVKGIKLLQLIKTIKAPMLQRKWSSDQVNRALKLYEEKFPEFFGENKNYFFDINGNLIKPNFQ